MKVEELRGKKPEQLKADLAELKKEAFNLRFQLASGELSNTARIRQVRRNIARVQSVLSEQRLASAA